MAGGFPFLLRPDVFRHQKAAGAGVAVITRRALDLLTQRNDLTTEEKLALATYRSQNPFVGRPTGDE